MHDIHLAYAVTEAGVVNDRTIFGHARGAMVNWISLKAGAVHAGATEEQIRKAFASYAPLFQAKLVELQYTITNADVDLRAVPLAPENT